MKAITLKGRQTLGQYSVMVNMGNTPGKSTIGFFPDDILYGHAEGYFLDPPKSNHRRVLKNILKSYFRNLGMYER